MLPDQDQHDFHAVRDAVVEAIRSGALPRERVAEAAARVARMAERVRSRPAVPEIRFDAAAVVQRAVTVRGRLRPLPDVPTAVIDIRRRSSLAVDSAAGHVALALAAGGPTLRWEATADAVRVDAVPVATGGGPLIVLADRLDAGAAQRALAERLARESGAVIVDVGVPGPAIDDVPVIEVRGAGLLGAQQARRLLVGAPYRPSPSELENLT
jgi:beta-N-acetylhexosaminidase